MPLWRLYLLRFGYLFLGAGLAVWKWPGFIHHEWTLMEGVVNCMLAAFHPCPSGDSLPDADAAVASV